MMKLTCLACGGVETTILCKRCEGTGSIEIASDDCPHYLTGTASTTFCADCGDHLIGGEWFPSPGVQIAKLNAEIERLKEDFRIKEELYRHALDHVVHCQDGCSACQRLARDTLNRAGS